MKTTVIYHSADYDGIFCREIARKFLPDAELIGWDFADKPLTVPSGTIYILDLPVDRPFGANFTKGDPFFIPADRLFWIDHHKSSIDSHPKTVPGCRIDGVAACRLAWQWFSTQQRIGCTSAPWEFPKQMAAILPTKEDYIERRVVEPLAVRLAGEYVVWDKRDPDAEIFQFGLRSRELTTEDWKSMLDAGINGVPLLQAGRTLQRYHQKNDAAIMHHSFVLLWESLRFLALNTAQCNSLTFASKDEPTTGHDALMGFFWNGSKWTISMYHAKHRTDLDLSAIAVRHGGGGHRGVCGFTADKLPFVV